MEVNENRCDILEINSHLGLPSYTYHELPDFDDPFAEWDDATTAAAVASCSTSAPSGSSRHAHRIEGDDDEETEADEPTDYHEQDDDIEEEDDGDE